MTDRTPRPVIENAPGLVLRPINAGWLARWQCRTDLVARGFEPKSARLWAGATPSDLDKAMISDACNRLQNEMLVFGRGGLPTVSEFTGTMASLISSYQHDPVSGYRKIRYKTRANYDSLLRRIEADHGETRLAEVRYRHLLHWHQLWSADGKDAMAHALVGMLRTLFGFGATILEDEECERLCAVGHKLRVKMAKPREERLTAEQATAIRAIAHERGRPSIALAQAFQFECMLRQKDVIGEWVPISEPGNSAVTNGNEKWLRGIRWNEIDPKMVLRHTTSKRQKDIEVNLHLAPMVMEELRLINPLPSSGPIVINETTGLPYSAHEFRRQWRLMARAAGVPDKVYNMDSRAGAISEALLAGAPMDSVRKTATHSNSSMTQRYSRGDAEAVSEVAQIRAAHRNKKAT